MKLPWQRKAGENGADEIEVTLPDELKTRLENSISKGDFDSKLAELQASLSSISTRFQREDEERARASARKAQEDAATKNSYTKEQLDEMMLTDPVSAVQRLIKDQSESQNQVLLSVRADALRREVFEDQDKFQYYTGDLKQEVDKLLEAQTLAARNDRSVIEHAYYSTVGRHQRDLSDGKLKNRFAASDTGDRTTTGRVTSGTDPEELRPMSDDDRKAARILGFDEKEYQKMLKEEGVGYV